MAGLLMKVQILLHHRLLSNLKLHFPVSISFPQFSQPAMTCVYWTPFLSTSQFTTIKRGKQVGAIKTTELLLLI